MAEDKYTRCPGCATVFRVTDQQLAVREGQVRCGQCKTVFDGNAHRTELGTVSGAGVATPDSAATVAPEDGTPAGPAASATRAAREAVNDGAGAPAESAAAAAAADTIPSAMTGAVPTAAAPEAASMTAAAVEPSPADDAAPPVAYEDRFAPVPRPTSRRARAAWYASATALLLVALALQAVLHFHDAIAAHWPAARPALDRLCGLSGCAIRPLRDPAMSDLSIESSDLQADPAHRGLLVLTASVRNRATWPVAYPHLELTLTDAQDRIVVRRALTPADYVGGTTDVNAGLAANAELALKVFIDASATTQAGYRLYMFYP